MSHTKELARIIADVYNETKEDKFAIANYTSQIDIVDSAQDYNLVLEAGEVPLTQAPLTLSGDLHIVIDLLDKFVVIPKLTYGYNYFSLTGKIKTIGDFMDWLNDVFLKTMSPQQPLGRFKIDDENLITYISPSDTSSFLLVDIFFSEDLSKALKGFCASTSSFTDSGRKYYYFNPQTTGVSVKQSSRSINSLITMKSIRLLTDLPVLYTMITAKNSKELVYENMIGTIIINSEEFDLVNRRNQLYIPTSEMKRVQLYGEGGVKSFRIEARIYYSDGQQETLVMAPKEFMTFNLLFEKKIK